MLASCKPWLHLLFLFSPKYFDLIPSPSFEKGTPQNRPDTHDWLPSPKKVGTLIPRSKSAFGTCCTPLTRYGKILALGCDVLTKNLLYENVLNAIFLKSYHNLKVNGKMFSFFTPKNMWKA